MQLPGELPRAGRALADLCPRRQRRPRHLLVRASGQAGPAGLQGAAAGHPGRAGRRARPGRRRQHARHAREGRLVPHRARVRRRRALPALPGHRLYADRGRPGPGLRALPRLVPGGALHRPGGRRPGRAALRPAGRAARLPAAGLQGRGRELQPGPGGLLEGLDRRAPHLPLPARPARPGAHLAVPARRARPHAALQVPRAGPPRPHPHRRTGHQSAGGATRLRSAPPGAQDQRLSFRVPVAAEGWRWLNLDVGVDGAHVPPRGLPPKLIVDCNYC
ncbi:hypothetical protein FOCC_FOCC007657 [Frankliniella occidentalis]|nr:hypothetical protein FOCC_FOCC007657 [Frankliniella occidentalis]